MNTEEKRADYIEGLRAIADMLETHGDIPLPVASTFTTFFSGDDAPAQMAAIRRVIGGRWTKTATDSWFWLRKPFGPHEYDLTAARNIVCQRVVVGTEQVEEPDPEAPKVVVEKEIIEWRCSPLLDDEPASGAA